MVNLRNRVDIQIVRSSEERRIRRLNASPLYSRFSQFSRDLVGYHMHKSKIYLDKPVYTGISILDLRKIHMYRFYYDKIKAQYGNKCELIYTDTDSLLMEIQTEDIYQDMAKKISDYDTSDYQANHFLYSAANKKVIGKMKDECAGVPIAECVCLRSKMYSILKADEGNINKAKGVKKCVVKKELKHEKYRQTLEQGNQIHNKMNILHSERQHLWSESQQDLIVSV